MTLDHKQKILIPLISVAMVVLAWQVYLNFFNIEEDFAPDRIWRAKNLGNVDKAQQLHFVDAGLMPLLEHEMGERLGGLMRRVIGLLQNGFTEKQLVKNQNQRWIFRAAFWLLCAKILKDKGVRNFVRLDINDVDASLNSAANTLIKSGIAIN